MNYVRTLGNRISEETQPNAVKTPAISYTAYKLANGPKMTLDRTWSLFQYWTKFACIPGLYSQRVILYLVLINVKQYEDFKIRSGGVFMV